MRFAAPSPMVALAGLLLALLVAVDPCPHAAIANPLEADAARRGQAVAAEAVQRVRGFGDYQVDVRMVLTHPDSGVDTRQLRVKYLESADGGERSLVVFDAPADQRGTALLTHSTPGLEDAQWLFLPALRRVKRIAGGHRSGPFVGSEFAYEDLTEQQLARYRYRYLDAQPLGGVLCDRVERWPVDRHSGYSRQIAWYDREARRLRRIDFFDRRGEPVKRLVASQFELFDGRWWRPRVVRMDNLQSRKRTELFWGAFRFGSGLDAERDLSVRALERVR